MYKLMWFLFIIISFNTLAVAADINGQQPNAAIDIKGTIRMVYGDKENIFCITSKNNGTTFSEPELVGQIVGMHLGNTRGPQIASSKKFSMITAIDNKGKIHSYRLNHLSNTWKKTAQVNDIKGSAVEGLMALTADNEDNFYATWLDIRIEEKNNIYFSSINEEATAWGKNHLVYKSPDEHVCECCKPNIAFSNNKLVISFRNWLLGSRDIYYAISSDMGKNFSAPVKSGKGTWQLNACPMDGGGLAINESGVVSAAWRRNSDIFYSSGNKPERKLSVGRDVSLSQNKLNTVVAWQDKNKVQVLQFNTQKVTDLGNGTSPKVYVLPNGKTICMWEDDKIIRFKII